MPGRAPNRPRPPSVLPIAVLLTGALCLLAAQATAAAAGSRGPQQPDELYRQGFDAVPGGSLRVDVPDADVVLRNGPPEQVMVVVQLTGRDRSRGREFFERMRFDAAADERGVVVHAEPVGALRWRLFGHGSWGLTVEITLPDSYDLDVKTSDGDVDAAVHRGEISLATSDGDVVADRLEGSVRIHTSDGDIALHAGEGTSAELVTSDGDVRLGTTGFDRLLARTSDGDVVVERLSGGAELRSSDGDIVVRAAFGPLQARTQDGDVHVRLMDSVAATLRSSDGDIRIEAPADLHADIRLQGEEVSLAGVALDGTVGPRSAEGLIGGGGPRIEASTSGGDVTLRLHGDS